MSEYTKILRDAAERGIRCRESLDGRRVGPAPAAWKSGPHCGLSTGTVWQG